MLRILSYLKPHKKRAAVVALLMLISTLIAILPPYFTKILLDDVLKLNEGARSGSRYSTNSSG